MRGSTGKAKKFEAVSKIVPNSICCLCAISVQKGTRYGLVLYLSLEAVCTQGQRVSPWKHWPVIGTVDLRELR